MNTLLALGVILVLFVVGALTTSVCRAQEDALDWLRLPNGDVLCAKCPICGTSEEHMCASSDYGDPTRYVVDSAALAYERAREKLWRENSKADICGFCQATLAVADTQGVDPAPICAGCMHIWTTDYPERAPCIPRKAS